jgi:hypothetical protein
MIRLVVDLFVNQYTIRRFLSNKSHDPYRYHTEFLNEDETDTLHESNNGSFSGSHNAAGVVQLSKTVRDVAWEVPMSIQSTTRTPENNNTPKTITPIQSSRSVSDTNEPAAGSKKHRGRESA